jgi:MFS family permease
VIAHNWIDAATSAKLLSVKNAASRPGGNRGLCSACRRACGLPVIAAVSIYSVEGLSGLAGRIVFGLLGDKFGVKRTSVSGLIVQAIAAGSYLFARQQSEFYAMALVFGFAYAGVMPLYAVLVRENFPLPIIGTIVGATSMASSLGMAAK